MARPVTKKKLLEQAAIELFATKGLARTTVKDIANKAYATEGALYRHYNGKNEMAWALFNREVDRFTAGLSKLLFAEDVAYAARVDQAVRFFYSEYEADPMRFSFILLTQHHFPDQPLLDEERNPNDILIRFVRQVLADTGATEAATGDPEFTAAMLLGLVLQPLVYHRNHRVYGRPMARIKPLVNAALAILHLQA